MVPVDRIPGKVDCEPARQIGWAGISLWIGIEQHCLLVEAADSNADHRPAVPMMIVAELRELLPADEEGGLAVGWSLIRLRQLQRRFAHSGQYIAHRVTNSLNTFGYNKCSAASTL